jgi:hypothetical protein
MSAMVRPSHSFAAFSLANNLPLNTSSAYILPSPWTL